MKRMLHVVSAVVLVILMGSQGFGLGVRSNSGAGKMHGRARATEVHHMKPAKKHKKGKKGHEDKDRDSEPVNRAREKGKEKGEAKH